MTTITHAEWVKAFEDALENRPVGDEGMTSGELADAMGITVNVINQRLRQMHKAGRLEAGRSRRASIDGRMMSVPVYRLKA